MNTQETILIIPEGKVRDYVDGTIRNDTHTLFDNTLTLTLWQKRK